MLLARFQFSLLFISYVIGQVNINFNRNRGVETDKEIAFFKTDVGS